MQYQKKQDEKDKNQRKKENSDSDYGEMIYVEPIGNQVLDPINIGLDQINENNENRLSQQQQQLNNTNSRNMRKDLKNKVNLSKISDEDQIHSIEINIPQRYEEEKREKSPKTINIGTSKEEIENNYKTLNQKRTPIDNYQYKSFNDSQNYNSFNDSRGFQQVNFGPRSNISRSPGNFQRNSNSQYFQDDRRDGGGIIPFNKMSPNINDYEEMNLSGEKIELTNPINNYRVIKINSNQRNTSYDRLNRYGHQKLNNLNRNLIRNKKSKRSNRNNRSNRSINKNNNNLGYNEVKKIMKRFSRIYNPKLNNHGALIHSSQISVPGEIDDIFTNRARVLSKMNRLSNILLSNKKKSRNKYQENSNLNIRSRSKSKNKSSLSISSHERKASPYLKNLSHNKFLFVSLAMMSSKGPNVEDRTILRKMRLDKGGVVDLAPEERRKTKYKIKKVTKNKAGISYYHTNPKYRETAARIIQNWWAQLKSIYTEKLKKIILIQSIIRGRWVRKNMYDLLYLNYLYICFCRKIERVLSLHIRPMVFYKLFGFQDEKPLLLRKIILEKQKTDKMQSIIQYWNKWASFVKNLELKNKLGKQLIDIRSNKENKLNVLFAFFNKWKYITKISNISPDQNVNIYPLNKINGFCKIMDAAKKYVQKKALRKILSDLIKYLSIQARENLLKKIIMKKTEYEKYILRNTLYLWYSKILNFQKVSNEEETNKLREMKLKIFDIILSNFKRKLDNRYLRKYLIRLYLNAYPETINKYIIYEILRKINLNNLNDGEEELVNIRGKKYKVIKSQKDLRIIRAEELDSIYNDEEEIIENYEDIISKIKKDKKGEYKEGEEIPSDVKKDLDIIGRKKKERKRKEEEENEESENSERSTQGRIVDTLKVERKSTKSFEDIEELERNEELEDENEELGRRKKNKIVPKRKKYTPKSSLSKEDRKKHRSKNKKNTYEKISESDEEETEEYDERGRGQYKYEKNRKRSSSKRGRKGRPIRKIRRGVSPASGRRIKKVYVDKRRDEYSPSDEYEEIEDDRRYRRKPIYKYIKAESLEPRKRRYYRRWPSYEDETEKTYSSYEEIIYRDRDDYYHDKIRPEKSYDDRHRDRDRSRKRTKGRYIRKKTRDDDYDELEESSEDRYEKRPKKKYVIVKKDRNGKEYYEEEVSSSEEKDNYINKGKKKGKIIKEKRKKSRKKSQKMDEEYDDYERKIDKKRKKKYDDSKKIREVGENEESEDFDIDESVEDERQKRGRKKKSPIEEEYPIDVYDKNHRKITNLEKYKNRDGTYDIDLYDKDGNLITDLKKYKRKKRKFPEEIYDKDGRRLIDLDKYRKKNGDYDIELYDKNGKIITNLKKYRNEKGDLTIPLYDKNNRRVVDLKKFKNKDDIDLYDKYGNIITNLKRYKKENEEEEEEEDEDYPEVYDKKGNRVTDLEKYKNRDGYYSNLYDKNGNKIIDLKKYKNKDGDYDIDLYNKNGKRITNLQKYKNKDGDYDIDLYDKNGRRLIDFEKFKDKKQKRKIMDESEEEYPLEVYDKKGNIITDLEKYKSKDGNYEIDVYDKNGNIINDLLIFKKPVGYLKVYDKNGRIITNLKKYKNGDGDYDKELYDKDNNKIIDLQKYKNQKRFSFDLYDKYGKIITNIEKYRNKDGEYDIEVYDKNGKNITNLKKYRKESDEIEYYDKNGNPITNIEKYKNRDDSYNIDLYDEYGNRLMDLRKYEKKDNDLPIDVYDKYGKIITNLEKYRNEDGDIVIDLYDKNGRKITDLRKYKKEEEGETPFYDRDGRRIVNLAKYKKEDNNYDIDLYNKRGKRITNLEKYKNEDGDYNIDLYDKEGRRLIDLEKHKTRKGDYDIDLYDKYGNIITDFRKYKKEEEEYPKELYDKRGRKLIDLKKYKNKDGNYDIELYDKNGKIITNLKKYINKDGDFTIPVYDKDNNIVINIEKYKNNDGGYNIDLYDKDGKRISKIYKKKIPLDVYDKYGKRITNLEKYRNEDGDIIIDLYDKNGKIITDFKKYKREESEEEPDIIRYKTKDGDYSTDIYDKNRKNITDFKKYKKEEEEYPKELYDKRGRRLIDLEKYKNKDGNYDIELYDKNKNLVTNIDKYLNRDGDFKIPLYDKDNNIVISLEKYKNKDGGYDIELYDKYGKRITDLREYQKEEEHPIDLYDKKGKRISNLEIYKNKNGDILIPVYDKDGNRIIDLDKNIENADLFDKNGNKINNLEQYKNKYGEYDIDLYDKDGRIVVDLKKYKKEEEFPKELYDKRGTKLIDLQKYKNEDGNYDIELYDKNGKIITNIKKYINKDGDLTIPVYDKDNNIVINIEKYKNKNGGYDIDLYDKNGKIITDFKKYKREESEEEPDIIRYKTKDGDYAKDIYDKNGKIITDLAKYKSKDGQYTIPIYDKNRNIITKIERLCPETNNYEPINITRYKINPNDQNKDLTKLSEHGKNYIPSYVKNKAESKMKPITLIGEKTEIGRLLEKYNFLRQNNFSLNNLQERDKNIYFDPKKALLLDLLNEKEQKTKLLLWKYFCIWRGNALNRYQELGDLLKFVRGAALTNLKGDFIESLKNITNPRLYSLALRKLLMNLFNKNIDLLRDAFNKWKKVVNKEKMTSLKSKFFYSLCKKNDEKIEKKDDGVNAAINKVDNLRKNKILNFRKQFPNDLKNVLSLYFNRWRGDKNIHPKFFIEQKTISLPNDLKRFVFKKDKISEDFIRALLENIPEKEKIDIKEWIKNPLRRTLVIRYRRERMVLFRYLIKWHYKVRLMSAINHLERIVEGKLNLTRSLRLRPSKILYKKMKLMNPKFYKLKGEKLVTLLLKIVKNRPFKELINNLRLLNRVNLLRYIQPKIHEIISSYILGKYLDKWRNNVNEMKEQKIKLLLTYVKKKIKDEGIINQKRKNELLKRIINNLIKGKTNNLLLAFKIWNKITKILRDEKKQLIKEAEGGIITNINGKQKIIDGKEFREGGGINVKIIKNKDGGFTIEDIANTTLTENERQEILQKKLPETFYLIDDKIKSLLKIKFYQWKNIASKISINQNARIIQRFFRRKLGHYFSKKRKKFFSDLAKNYLKKIIFNIARINYLNNILKNIMYRRFFDKLVENSDRIISITNLYDSLFKADENLINQNKKIVIKKILKIYTYTVLKKFFENINNAYKKNLKIALRELLSSLKGILLKKAEYSYGTQISNEKQTILKKFSFSSKKQLNNFKGINQSIPYISTVPHLIKYLDGKIKERKDEFYQKLKSEYKNKKLCFSLLNIFSARQKPDKTKFLKTLKKSSTSGEAKVTLYKLFRRKLIKKILTQIEEPSRLLKIMYLMKMTIVSKEIAEKRWIRLLLRKWRFIVFSKIISKRKMESLYKHLHVNYLEMVNDVFGEEEQSNPSVIKEFERFGTNVGMWENENPDFIEESNFCKNIQKRFSFHPPAGLSKKMVKEIKEVKDKELVKKKEFIKEEIKEDEKKEEENNDTQKKNTRKSI